MYGKNIERARGIADLFQEVLKTDSSQRSTLRSWENQNILIEQLTTLIKHSSLKLLQVIHVIDSTFLSMHCYPHLCTRYSTIYQSLN